MALPSLSIPGLSFGTLSYKDIQGKYDDFAYPQARIILNNKPFKDKKKKMIINDVNVELTCGFEASIARFRIFNVFDTSSGEFNFEPVKKQIALGTSMTIEMGYLDALQTVFTGFIAEVSFGYDPVDLPYIEVVGMDVKGIMMSNAYAKQTLATSYGAAVREIMGATAYITLQSGQAITGMQISDTPDMAPPGGAGGASAESIEMVSESDYEFVVKAAKKFNFEFFVDCGVVYFRPAKNNTTPLMKLGLGAGIVKFNVAYSLSGLVGSIESRSINAGDGKIIKATANHQEKISTGSKAGKLIKKSKKVYIDPSISSQADADKRVASLMETMSYRFGTLECECPGIPELKPGRFIKIEGMGSPVDNKFYVTTVVHDYRSDTGYRTKITAKASGIQDESLLSGALGALGSLL